MTLAHDPDHAARGVERLIERYRRPRTSALLASWLGEVQAVEDALWQLLVERSIDTAEGAQLDVLGAIVGQPRRGMDDDTYRVWIEARNQVNRSSGTTSEMLSIARALLPWDSVLAWEEYYPAAVVLRVDGDVTDVADHVAYMLHLAKPAGVQFQLHWLAADAGETFTMAATLGTAVADSPMGFDRGHFAFASEGADIPFELDVAPGQIVVNDDPVVVNGNAVVIT